MFCQFYVSKDKTLSCLLYQRSCDIGLGVPFNIASYSLLTCLIAHVCDLEPGMFIHTMGDAHIYLNHVDALKIQVGRECRPFPKLNIKTPRGGGLEALEKISIEDIEIIDYNPHSKITMDMAV
jgi:thymidylate synthase